MVLSFTTIHDVAGYIARHGGIMRCLPKRLAATGKKPIILIGLLWTYLITLRASEDAPKFRPNH